MANWNRWGAAAGLAAALALFGTAQAQNATGGTGARGSEQGEKPGTGTERPGERSGWSGSEAKANRTGPATGSESSTSGTGQGSSGSSESQGSSGMGMGSSASSAQKLDKKHQEKLQRIHAANQAEIHMAQMGQQQATSPELKQYAEQLLQDHQQMDRQLTQAAQSMGVQLEGKEFQDKQKDAMKDMKKLQGKTGQEFDREYAKMMVKDHEKDLKEVQNTAKDLRKENHAELAATLDQAATKMQGHLQQAKQLEETVGKSGQKQSRGTSGASTGSGSSGAGTAGSGSSGSTNTGGSWSTGSGGSAAGSDTSSSTGPQRGTGDTRSGTSGSSGPRQ